MLPPFLVPVSGCVLGSFSGTFPRRRACGHTRVLAPESRWLFGVRVALGSGVATRKGPRKEAGAHPRSCPWRSFIDKSSWLGCGPPQPPAPPHQAPLGKVQPEPADEAASWCPPCGLHEPLFRPDRPRRAGRRLAGRPLPPAPRAERAREERGVSGLSEAIAVVAQRALRLPALSRPGEADHTGWGREWHAPGRPVPLSPADRLARRGEGTSGHSCLP